MDFPEYLRQTKAKWTWNDGSCALMSLNHGISWCYYIHTQYKRAQTMHKSVHNFHCVIFLYIGTKTLSENKNKYSLFNCDTFYLGYIHVEKWKLMAIYKKILKMDQQT